MAFAKTGNVMACQALVSRAASISFKPNRSIHRTVLFFALLLALIATGTTPAQASGELKFTPNAANFGRVPVGRTHTLTVTIANGGMLQLCYRATRCQAAGTA